MSRVSKAEQEGRYSSHTVRYHWPHSELLDAAATATGLRFCDVLAGVLFAGLRADRCDGVPGVADIVARLGGTGLVCPGRAFGRHERAQVVTRKTTLPTPIAREVRRVATIGDRLHLSPAVARIVADGLLALGLATREQVAP